MVKIGNFNFEAGMTKQTAIENNNNDQSVGLIFDVVDKNQSGTIEENELNINQNENEAIANPKMAKKLQKISTQCDELHKQLLRLESDIKLLEQNRNIICSQYEQNKSSELAKQIDDLNKDIDKRNKNRQKIIEKINGLSGQITFLSEVNVETNMSDREISANAQQYMQQRNQLNPYYGKYQETLARYNTESDRQKRSELEQQLMALDELVNSWKPENIEYSAQTTGSSLNIGTNIKTDTNETTSSLNANLNSKIRNHTIGVTGSYTTTTNDEDETKSKNLNLGVTDTIEIGQKSNLTVRSGYTRYSSDSNESDITNDTFSNSLNFSTRIKNVTLGASYNNNYSHSEINGQHFSSNGETWTNGGGINLSHQIKKFNYSIGTNITNTKSDSSNQTLYSIPISTGLNVQNEHNNFGINASYTPTFGSNYNSQEYNLRSNYSHNNKNISFNSSVNLGYTKTNLSGETYRYGGNASITNNKYGYTATAAFQGSNSRYYDSYDASVNFSTPMSSAANLNVGAGYSNANGDGGIYGEVGVSFNINNIGRKKHK